MARVRNCLVAKADTSFDDIGLPLTEVDLAQPSGRPEPVPMLAKAAAKQLISGSKPCQTVKNWPGSDCNEMVVDLEYGLSPEHISLSPPRGLGTRGCLDIAHREEGQAELPGAAPLSSELRHHTAYPGRLDPEATWAQPLSREELS